MAGGPKMTSLGEGKNFFGGYWRKTGREEKWNVAVEMRK